MPCQAGDPVIRSAQTTRSAHSAFSGACRRDPRRSRQLIGMDISPSGPLNSTCRGEIGGLREPPTAPVISCVPALESWQRPGCVDYATRGDQLHTPPTPWTATQLSTIRSRRTRIAHRLRATLVAGSAAAFGYRLAPTSAMPRRVRTRSRRDPVVFFDLRPVALWQPSPVTDSAGDSVERLLTDDERWPGLMDASRAPRRR